VVEDKLAEAGRTLSAGLPLPDTKVSLGDWLTEWLANLQGLKPSTVHYYRQYLTAYVLRSELASKQLAKVEKSDLLHLYRRMTAPKGEGGLGLSTTTAHHLAAILHLALEAAVEDGKVARNAATLVPSKQRPRVSRSEMQVLADDDFDRFFEAIKGDRLEALFVVAIREGLRQGEILALRWQDVDLERGVVTVVGSLSRMGRSEPKSEASRRSVVLFDETVEALRSHRARQLQERLLVGTMWQDRDLVFPNEFGDFQSPNRLRERLKAILARSGLPQIRFHDLRHSAATNWLKGDMHPKVASERLGHASVAITLDLYSHVTLGMQREAVAAITRKRARTPGTA
jgi:integrase